MRIAQDNPLPLWDQASVVDGGAIAAGGDPSNSRKTLWIAEPDSDEEGKKAMLVLIPKELEKVLRDIVRDVDGVDEELRKKISQHLDRKLGTDEIEDGKLVTRRALPPTTLAQVVPHVRRLRLPGGGGLLRLLRGGRLVFPDARVLPPKLGEEKRVYDQRIEWLLLRREQKDYARMTANIQRAPRETVRDIQEGFKFQAGMGMNMILAAASAFIIGYWASGYVVDKDNTGHRMAIGLVATVFVLLVELLVFVMRSLKADQVLEAARQDLDDLHTSVGVPRAISAPAPPRRGGRGVLDAGRGRATDKARGEYEMIPQREGADDAAAAAVGLPGQCSDGGEIKTSSNRIGETAEHGVSGER